MKRVIVHYNHSIPSGFIKHGKLGHPRTQWRFIAGKINYAWSINADYMFPLNLRRHRLFHTDTYVSFLKWGGFLGYVAPNDPKLDHFFGLKPMVLDPILVHPHL